MEPPLFFLAILVPRCQTSQQRNKKKKKRKLKSTMQRLAFNPKWRLLLLVYHSHGKQRSMSIKRSVIKELGFAFPKDDLTH